MKREAERWLFDHKSEEWKKGETESQFLYKTRKYAIGPFKEKFWNLPEGTREAIRGSLERKFAFLFEKLRIAGTRAVVDKYVRPVEVGIAPAAAGAAGYIRDDQAGD